MTVKERPILFSGEMVRAILEGRKTQTRRVVKKQPGGCIEDCYPRPDGLFIWLHLPRGAGVGMGNPFACPFGVPGDRLWVRETFCTCTNEQGFDEGFDPSIQTCFRADGKARCDPDEMTWTPSIYMPRITSRITLEITGVRVERVQDISNDEAKSEGCDDIFSFMELWDSLSKPGAKWDGNPWVWVIGFKRVENA